ncbi:hypothetical protein niasHS_006361 [Heterodera schachtii]|uniref:Uncharacterized protein n=1 Tax=Heterodera schachtii TaxID=97005 RepID=A0ABD2JWI0_HETSC
MDKAQQIQQCTDQLNIVWANILSMASPVQKRIAAERFYSRKVSWHGSIYRCALEVNNLLQKAAAIVDECCEHAASTAGDIQELKNFLAAANWPTAMASIGGA